MYFPDLSPYSFFLRPEFRCTATNVGWLGPGREFPTKLPTKGFLSLLWSYCSISVTPTRGWYSCHLCDDDVLYHEFDGSIFMLGTAEIRVFSEESVFAAPNLIFHYVAAHRFDPPEVFKSALLHGPKPGTKEYSDRLDSCGYNWQNTYLREPNTPARRYPAY